MGTKETTLNKKQLGFDLGLPCWKIEGRVKMKWLLIRDFKISRNLNRRQI